MVSDVQTLKIQSIWGGISPSQYFAGEGQYNSSIGIDPDFPVISTDIRTSGFIVPVGYAKFSGGNVNSSVVSIINNPIDALTYVVLSNGRLISYSASLGSETLIGTVSGSNASGAHYYNNYIWIFGTGASKDDVSRYGPLSSSPAIIDSTWKGAGPYASTSGGFALTALTNTSYPSFRTVSMPNHPTHVHSDNALYFGDFKNGQGFINKIAVKTTTVQGDTNNGSSYQSLSLPYGFYPTALESFGIYLMILGLFSTDTTGPVNQGRAAFILWDTTNTTNFALIVYLQDPIGSALKNVNGVVHVWTGNSSGGVRLSRYLGGEYTKEVCFQEEGLPPFCYAVDSLGSRVVWGGFTTNPAVSASIWAWGSKDSRFPSGLHNVAKLSSSGTNPITTAVRYAQQANNSVPKIVGASTDGSGNQVDKFSATATLASNFRFMVNFGQKFYIDRIMFPLSGTVNSTTSIAPTVYIDELSTTKTLPVINNTNYPSKRKVLYKGVELKDFTGQNNFVLELAWTNTNPLAVNLPITIDYHLIKDESV